jgi:hypothetical protein
MFYDTPRDWLRWDDTISDCGDASRRQRADSVNGTETLLAFTIRLILNMCYTSSQDQTKWSQDSGLNNKQIEISRTSPFTLLNTLTMHSLEFQWSVNSSLGNMYKVSPEGVVHEGVVRQLSNAWAVNRSYLRGLVLVVVVDLVVPAVQSQ